MSATEILTTKEMDDGGGWEVECSDDELYGKPDSDIGAWIPPVADIVRLYTAFDEKKPVQLDWQCPGRRQPSPTVDHTIAKASETRCHENYASDKPPTEFDFDDIFPEQLEAKITPRRTPGFSKQLKGSGQKRTASFKNVMFDIRRQMRLDKLDKRPTGGSADGSSKEKKNPLNAPSRKTDT